MRRQRRRHRPVWASPSTYALLLTLVGAVWISLIGPSPWGWIPTLLGLALLTRHPPRHTPLDVSLRLLLVTAALNLLITPFPETTTPQVSRLVAGIACYVALTAWARTPDRLRWCALGLVALGAAAAVLTPVVVDWQRSKAFLVALPLYDRLPTLLADTVHPNVMASALVLLLPLPVAWLLHAGGAKPRMRWALGLAAGTIAAALVLTQSRGGYLAAAVAVILATWFAGRRRWAVALGAGTVAAAAALLWLTSRDASPDLVAAATNPNTLAFRLTVWRTALWMLEDFAFTGAGMGNFNAVGSLLYPFYEPANPGAHNLVLQVGADLGLPGLIAWLASCLLTVWLGARTLRRTAGPRHAWVGGALAGFLGLLAHGLVDNTLWNTRAAALPWLVMGVVVAGIRGRVPEAGNRML